MATKTSKSTTTSVKPLNDHILVRPAEAEEGAQEAMLRAPSDGVRP